MLVKGHFECYLCDITQPQIMKKDEKISGKFTELVQKEYENEEMRGKKHGSGYRAVGGANRKCGRAFNKNLILEELNLLDFLSSLSLS